MGTKWRLRIYPNAYYNCRKGRKKSYYARKKDVKEQIEEIYHEHMGVDGYRRMAIYLAQKGFEYSFTTIHKRTNKELGQRFIVRRKKPGYRHGTAHKAYDNLLRQDFTADRPNQKWCTDFTYLFLKSGEVRYNCTILDIFDHSVVASITDRNITSNPAVQKILDSQQVKVDLILGLSVRLSGFCREGRHTEHE